MLIVANGGVRNPNGGVFILRHKRSLLVNKL